MARLLRARELSARDVVGAHLDQIARVNPTVNAIVTLVADQAMDQARLADEAIAGGRTLDRCMACRSRTRICSSRAHPHDIRLAHLQ